MAEWFKAPVLKSALPYRIQS
jgi:hypothetical protein